MPNYTFELRDGSDPIGDELGVILTDRLDAYYYARGVVRAHVRPRSADPHLASRRLREQRRAGVRDTVRQP